MSIALFGSDVNPWRARNELSCLSQAPIWFQLVKFGSPLLPNKNGYRRTMMALEAATSVILAMVSALGLQSAGAAGVVRESLRQPMKFVDLTYPPEALEARVQGFVVLDLILDDQGRVTSTHV